MSFTLTSRKYGWQFELSDRHFLGNVLNYRVLTLPTILEHSFVLCPGNLSFSAKEALEKKG